MNSLWRSVEILNDFEHSNAVDKGSKFLSEEKKFDWRHTWVLLSGSATSEDTTKRKDLEVNKGIYYHSLYWLFIQSLFNRNTLAFLVIYQTHCIFKEASSNDEAPWLPIFREHGLCHLFWLKYHGGKRSWLPVCVSVYKVLVKRLWNSLRSGAVSLVTVTEDKSVIKSRVCLFL